MNGNVYVCGASLNLCNRMNQNRMRPSRNAFLGYTYQQCITFLMLVKMDVEREIREIEIEANTDNNFDDIRISTETDLIYSQIKDIDHISFSDLKIDNSKIIISGKTHILSDRGNILFFKNIDLECNDSILGFPAYKTSNIYIISLSRAEALNKISEFYQYNQGRESVINKFFNCLLDARIRIVNSKDLPIIDIYDIHLLEKTINVGKKLLEFEDILFVEGKPGVGKSHLVTCLANEFDNSLIYRFWISNQDKDYSNRLMYENFLTNISKELFRDFKNRTEDEIIEYLYTSKKTVIIDGLDHVENYQENQLSLYIGFIDKLKGKCKTIIFSRPLKTDILWAKQQLENWNFNETVIVLKELYHITDYRASGDIYLITDGYPILVRFIAENYKLNNELPLLEKLTDTNMYYESIISNTKLLSALTLFLSTRSFIMYSEIDQFLDNELSDIVKEFVRTYKYLFEIKLNRISLFHDSFNTFLRNKKIDFSKRRETVNQIVYKSLMNDEKRFLSRFSFFDLGKSEKLDIIIKYASINYFQNLIKSCIDFEAIRVFYKQIREVLVELAPSDIKIINYYDLSLIINILQRDHVSTINEFLYTYVRGLLFNGYGDDDITSSGELFGMYYYIQTSDDNILFNLMSDNHYDTRHFYRELEHNIWKESNYFVQHSKPLLKTKQLRQFINQDSFIDTLEYVPHILANLYLHKTNIKELKPLQDAIRTYLDNNETLGVYSLKKALEQFKNVSPGLSQFFLAKAKDIILALGKDLFPNYYHTNTLQQLIEKNSSKGSFDVWPLVLNYIRLSLHEEKKIDIASVGYFFAMYEKRKDTTVINIHEALKVFEDKKLISIEDSINIILYTQSMSEKGIRQLLLNFIELHSPDIISLLVDKRHPDKYEIIWFDLSTKYINHFSDSLFNYALHSQLLHWHSHNKIVDFKEIRNVIGSNRELKLIETLQFRRYSIRIPEDHPSVKILEKLDCYFETYKPDDESKYIKTSEERYNNGILDSDSISFIKETKLRVDEIAGYRDDNYAAFADLDIYGIFDKEHIKENATLIIRNALIGKIKSLNTFSNLIYFPGNIPKFVSDYDVNVDYNEMYVSFMKFLEISLLTPTFDKATYKVVF